MDDTIVALATPSGIGAIGVIRLSGPDAIAIAQSVFSKKITDKKSHTLHFGRVTSPPGPLTLEGEGEAASDTMATIDEVVLSLFKGPNSYTGEDVIEISCHGSPYIQQKIIELLVRQGARNAKAGEFTLRAFINRKLDLTQAEAVADLIASDTETSHRMAMDQMRGGFSSKPARRARRCRGRYRSRGGCGRSGHRWRRAVLRPAGRQSRGQQMDRGCLTAC